MHEACKGYGNSTPLITILNKIVSIPARQKAQHLHLPLDDATVIITEGLSSAVQNN